MLAGFDFGVIANSWIYLFKVGKMLTLMLTLHPMLGAVEMVNMLPMALLSYLVQKQFVFGDPP